MNLISPVYVRLFGFSLNLIYDKFLFYSRLDGQLSRYTQLSHQLRTFYPYFFHTPCPSPPNFIRRSGCTAANRIQKQEHYCSRPLIWRSHFVSTYHSTTNCSWRCLGTGICRTLVAINCPALFSSLILVDPVITQPNAPSVIKLSVINLVTGAVQRRERWGSR